MRGWWLDYVSPTEFSELAAYNSDRNKAKYTAEYRASMEALQRKYNRARYENCIATGGIWMGDPPE